MTRETIFRAAGALSESPGDPHISISIDMSPDSSQLLGLSFGHEYDGEAAEEFRQSVAAGSPCRVFLRPQEAKSLGDELIKMAKDLEKEKKV